MSKAAKQSIIILIVLLVGTLAFAGYTLFQKQQVEVTRDQLGEDLSQTRAREKQKIREVAELADQLDKANTSLERAQQKYNDAQLQIQQLTEDVRQTAKEAQEWERKVSLMDEKRSELASEVESLRTSLQNARDEARKAQLALKKQSSSSSQDAQSSTSRRTDMQRSAPSTTAKKYEIPSAVDEQYWASLLQDKAALEVRLEEMRLKLSDRNVEIVELKQQNANYKVKIDSLKAERDEIIQEIKYKTDLVNNLSLELARTKNDKKFVKDRLDKLGNENKELRDQVRRLVSSKGALEKSIVRISKDKAQLSKKLEHSENMIQSKIDEIWDIKDDLDQTIETTRDMHIDEGIELPPIVVSADNTSVPFDPGMSSPGFNGKVVSINEDNNFVIVDLGENDGVKLGNVLSVYRDDKYIARLEVIQVRKDISAADIKDQWSRLKAGDIVR